MCKSREELSEVELNYVRRKDNDCTEEEEGGKNLLRYKIKQKVK